MNQHPTFDRISLVKSVPYKVGALDALVEKSSETSLTDEVDPTEVGNWITVIGKALLAIFK